MKRREFIALAASAAVWTIGARAQVQQVRRIGVLMPYPVNDSEAQVRLAAFRQELRRLGWSEPGIQFDDRWAGSDDPDRIRDYAVELANSKVDVILVQAPRALAPLQRATRSIPIVFVGVSDPVVAGFVETLARPGGNITGFTLIEFSIIGKLVEALKQIAPAISQVALISNPINPSTSLYLRSFESASASFDVRPRIFAARDALEIEHSFETIVRERNSGLLFPPDITILVHRELVTALAARYRLPAIYSDRALVANGGLMYYGAERIDQFRRAASYVDRILRGERPADLPVQQPTKFEFVLNLKTAKALGLTVPDKLLALADEVIE
jgi:putative ABC transport system substrate-binding protein